MLELLAKTIPTPPTKHRRIHLTFDDQALSNLKLLKRRLSATGAHYSYSSVVRVALDAYVKATNPQQP